MPVHTDILSDKIIQTAANGLRVDPSTLTVNNEACNESYLGISFDKEEPSK